MTPGQFYCFHILRLSFIKNIHQFGCSLPLPFVHVGYHILAVRSTPKRTLSSHTGS
jgi:hypothetical protein